jgi:O-antigen ligase
MVGVKNSVSKWVLNFILILNVCNITTGFLWLSFINTSGVVAVSSFYYRVFTFLIAIISIIISIKRKVSFFKEYGRILVYYYLFIILYSVRLFTDSIFYGYYTIIFDEGAWTFLLMSLGYILVEPISILSIDRQRQVFISQNLYYFFSLPIVLNVILNTGFNITPTIERESPFVGIGINNLGFLVAISLNFALLNLFNKIGSPIRVSYDLIVLTVSVYVLGVTGTKSGFVTTVVLMILVLLKSNIKRLLYIVFSIIAISICAYFTFDIWWEWVELYIKLFEQLISSGDEAREYIWSRAIDMFIKSPLFGSAFIIPNSGFFHNFLLDAFVSTGIIGGFFFLVYIFKVLRISLKAFKKNPERSFIPVALLTTFVAGMFSSNLYSNWLFWSFSILIVVQKNYLSESNCDKDSKQ